VRFVASLPRNDRGKVLRRELSQLPGLERP